MKKIIRNMTEAQRQQLAYTIISLASIHALVITTLIKLGA